MVIALILVGSLIAYLVGYTHCFFVENWEDLKRDSAITRLEWEEEIEPVKVSQQFLTEHIN